MPGSGEEGAQLRLPGRGGPGRELQNAPHNLAGQPGQAVGLRVALIGEKQRPGGCAERGRPGAMGALGPGQARGNQREEATAGRERGGAGERRRVRVRVMGEGDGCDGR